MAFDLPAPASSLAAWRAALLALALLAPLNLPFSIPSVDKSKVFGWSSTTETGGGEPVVTRTMRSARDAGLLPGDRLLAIDGERRDGVYVDCTFGRGGHSRLVLERLSRDGRLLAFDRDPEAIASASVANIVIAGSASRRRLP